MVQLRQAPRHLVQQAIRRPQEHPGVPIVTAFVQVALRRGGIRFLFELLHPERLLPRWTGQRFAAADVTVTCVWAGRRGPEGDDMDRRRPSPSRPPPPPAGNSGAGVRGPPAPAEGPMPAWWRP